jgi:hypothetical protein
MNRKSRKRSALVRDYVTVAFAEDIGLAREYEKLLAEHDIPAVVKNQSRTQEGDYTGIAVVVPEEYLDEAYALISKEASYDDFFDAAFGEQGLEEAVERDLSFYDDDEDEVY